MSEMILGSHLSFSAPGYFRKASEDALSYGENAFMIYPGAPQNTLRVPLDLANVEEGRRLLSQAGFPLQNVVAHAAYVINLAKADDPEKLAFARDFALSEIKRAKALGARNIVFHPGFAKNVDPRLAHETMAESFAWLCRLAPAGINVCIETMAGKKNELGGSFQEIADVFARLESPENLRVCLDTCHAHDAGYDLSDLDGFLSELDRELGISRVAVVHLNDSKSPRGAHADRHENIGCGHIGFSALRNIASCAAFAKAPKILETPFIGKKAPYREEIAMLRSGVYREDWRDDFLI